MERLCASDRVSISCSVCVCVCWHRSLSLTGLPVVTPLFTYIYIHLFCLCACALDRAIEAIVGMIGRFGGKDATSYLEAYRAEMVMRDIPEDRRLAGFPRVAMSGIDSEVLEARCRVVTCVRGEGRNHGGLGLRRRGEGIGLRNGA